MYQAVVNTYHPAGLDFDIEGGVNASVLMQALAGLKRAKGNLSISLTPPGLSHGFINAGPALVGSPHNARYNPPVVNVKAMDIGTAHINGAHMVPKDTQTRP